MWGAFVDLKLFFDGMPSWGILQHQTIYQWCRWNFVCIQYSFSKADKNWVSTTLNSINWIPCSDAEGCPHRSSCLEEASQKDCCESVLIVIFEKLTQMILELIIISLIWKIKESKARAKSKTKRSIPSSWLRRSKWKPKFPFKASKSFPDPPKHMLKFESTPRLINQMRSKGEKLQNNKPSKKGSRISSNMGQWGRLNSSCTCCSWFRLLGTGRVEVKK